MTQLKTLLFSLCLSCMSMTTFAQIQKGNYNFSGDVGLSLNSLSSNSFNFKEARLSLSPSIGKFLTDDWLVSVQPILSTQNQTYKSSDLIGNSYGYTSGQTDLGAGIGTRYYVSLSDKTRFFGAVNASLARRWANFSFDNQTFPSNNNRVAGSAVTYGGGVGLNVGMRQGVFFEASLSYNAEESTFSGGTRKSDFYSLSVGLNHFIVNPKKADIEDDYAFIKKGRQMFGGGLTVNKVADTYLTIVNPKFSQFVTDNILVSGEAFINNISGSGIDNQLITLTVASRYYFPVKKRLFIYPELAYTRRYENVSSRLSSNYHKNEVSLGIGGNYFLSKNVAIEATLLQARFNPFPENTQQKSFTGLIGLGNVGIVYFIR